MFVTVSEGGRSLDWSSEFSKLCLDRESDMEEDVEPDRCLVEREFDSKGDEMTVMTESRRLAEKFLSSGT